jgi:hypothetical protein
MAKVSESYPEIMEEFPAELRKPLLRLIDAVMERLKEEFAVRREDFEDLRSVVRELAEAQRKTEGRIEELAEAQRKTEGRIEELAEAQRKTEKCVEELARGQKRFERHFDAQIGALGARGGLRTEESFRAAVKGILGEDFGMHVERYEAYDETGEVFGRPEQVEIDLVIRDARITTIEIKSSMSKSDVYAFDRKVSLYENRHQVKVDRKIIITPMLDQRAETAVKSLGMKVYTSGYAWGDEETSNRAA